MACTTILVGKKASYDGSTMIARNDDSQSGVFTPKKFTLVPERKEEAVYKSVISKVKIELPKEALAYTCVPNALAGEGIWAACGVNSRNVAMTATETITNNERVLGADPLMTVDKDLKKSELYGGIGEEDLVVLVLPYIKTAREGVLRMAKLLETYGTYETNGMAFQDEDEIWWLETIGGHHYIAKRVPDDAYVMMPNQLGIDSFDFKDAFGAKKNHLCSSDLLEFIQENHLDLSMDGKETNPRVLFGTHSDSDHVYNTPRAWYMGRYFNGNTTSFDGPNARYTPASDDIPWSMKPEKKITIEDIKYILSSHYQGTPYDPYANYGEEKERGAYRSIGINRTDLMSLIQIRPYVPEAIKAIQWISLASNVFNTITPFYTQVSKTPSYLSNTKDQVSTNNYYWTSRLIAALSDAHYGKNIFHVERYQEETLSKFHALIRETDKEFAYVKKKDQKGFLEKANKKIADCLKEFSQELLGQVLYESSIQMKNSYARSDV